MARIRRMLSPIMAIKHYVHQTILSIVSGNIANIVIVDAAVAPANVASNDVLEGSVIKAVYIEMWYAASGATTTESSFTMTVEKISSNGPAMTFTNSSNLGAYLNKKNILYSTQGVLGTVLDGNQSQPLLRQFILIPKGKQRFGAGDRLAVNVSSVGNSEICGLFTYKEYR